jgi:hypothetical protein
MPRDLKNYKPGPFDHRPPLEVCEKRMHDLLDSALGHGFATGSIGATYSGEDEHFTFEVSYTIRRKRRKGFSGSPNADVIENGQEAEV